MRDFFTFARRMVKDRALLVAAMVCAVISAIGTGIGLMSMIAMIKLIVDKDEVGSLVLLAYRFNDGDHSFLGFQIDIPQWVIDVVPAGRFAGVVFIVAFMGLLTVIGAAANFLHQYLSITVASRTIANARLGVFRAAMLMPLVRANTRGASEFVTRIVRDSVALQRGLIALMSKSVAHATQAIVLFTVAVIVGRGITLAAIVIIPLLAVILRKIGKRIRRGTRGALKGQEHLLRIATESVQGLRAVKSNTGEAESIARFDEINQSVVRYELHARLARALSGPLVETVALFAVGGLAIFASKQIIDGPLTIERFVIALGALALAGSKFKMLAGLVNEMQAASPPARRLLDALNEAAEEPEGAPTAVLPRHTKSIRFKGVGYTYDGQHEPALADIDLDIRHGQRIAIVGPNGCGKTTLLSLVPRLLLPQSGQVLIDGTDIASVSLRSLREQIGVVTQETVLFRGKIADNISFGSEHASRSQIVEAARRAHAHEFIMAIPGGYDADVTEQGTSLSGGQRQRITIARAILRDPSILILDEATSQIDAESEHDIAAALAEFGRGRTLLLIAHRLATVRDADVIVVMDRGRIIDRGRHEELLDRCDLYRRLAQTQFAGDTASRPATPPTPTPATTTTTGPTPPTPAPATTTTTKPPPAPPAPSRTVT